jgi:hypothetical protein
MLNRQFQSFEKGCSFYGYNIRSFSTSYLILCHHPEFANSIKSWISFLGKSLAAGYCNHVIGMAKDKRRMEMAVEGDESKSSHKGAGKETKESKRLPGMPKGEKGGIRILLYVHK